jgi:DNA-binding NarL/FixJ family response regulator
MSLDPPLVRILLVDDQSLVCAALDQLFTTSERLQVVGSVSTIDEAKRRAMETRPDVIVLDVLANGDTFTSAESLQHACPGARIVILDEEPRDSHAREVLRLHLSGYLTKQQSPHEIVAALAQVSSGVRVFTPAIAKRLVLSGSGMQLMLPVNQVVSELTPRELEMLVRLAQGYSVKQCAASLGIGVSTAGNHKSRLMKKLGVHKGVELARLAIREGLVPK